MEIENLVELAKMGDKEALEEILKRFKPLLIKLSKTTFIMGYEGEDLIQTGYIFIINIIKKYDSKKGTSFTAYVSCALKNNFYNEIRNKVKLNAETSLNAKIDGTTEIVDFISSEENIEEDLIEKETYGLLLEALKKLSTEEQELLNFIYFNNGTITKYAELKNVKYITCAKRKTRALEKLRALLYRKY
jgi:RNA polymerase sporulation-specific sigma factor